MKVHLLGNWRLEVDPNLKYIDSDDEKRRYCKNMIKAIKRHVNGVDNITLQVDNESYCSHCQAPWTEVIDDYNGGCCEKDGL